MALTLRPNFSVDLAVPSHAVIARLATELAAGPMDLRRTRVPGGGREVAVRHTDHLMLTVPAAQQRFWSAWLTVDISPREGGTHVLARFSPHPSVWTGFAFGYMTLGAVLVFSLVFSAALVMTDSQPWSLWVSAGTVLALGGLWLASHLGQRLAHPQMEALRHELERALATCEPG